MIRVTFGPAPAGSKFIPGHVEVDGIDISSRITALKFTRDASGANLLDLRLVLYGEDVLDLVLPDDAVDVTAQVIEASGRVREARSAGDEARPYLLAGKR